jgi:hypothetical protein
VGKFRSLLARSRGRASNSKPSSESSMSPDSAHQRSERMEPERSEEEPNPWRTNSLRHGCLFSGRLVRRTRAESRPSNAEGSREFKSPCTFFAVTSHRLFESSWPNGSADQKSLDALSTSPQAGFLNRSQSLWTLWATPSFMFGGRWEYEYGRLAGSATNPLRFERLARTRALVRLTVDARPVGSCAASASTGVMRHHRRPKRRRRWSSGKRLSDLRRHRLGQ